MISKFPVPAFKPGSAILGEKIGSAILRKINYQGIKLSVIKMTIKNS